MRATDGLRNANLLDQGKAADGLRNTKLKYHVEQSRTSLSTQTSGFAVCGFLLCRNNSTATAGLIYRPRLVMLNDEG